MPTSPSVATTRPGGIRRPKYRRSLMAISRAPTLTKIRRTITSKIITATSRAKRITTVIGSMLFMETSHLLGGKLEVLWVGARHGFQFAAGVSKSLLQDKTGA